jgi:ubiquinone/menaquinone biosynthesis C-methylase UbiE
MTSPGSKSADETLRLEFNEWALAGKGESMERGHRPMGEQAINRLAVPRDARVLDVGCGSGWASRLLAQMASNGRVVGIDISDEMIAVAQQSSEDFSNVEFRVASAERLPFKGGEFTHAFSMESLYYYEDMSVALREILRVLQPGGVFVNVVDLYQENPASHQWIEDLKVPVQLLSTAEYQSLFEAAGFTRFESDRLLDPSPIPAEYKGSSFKSYEDFVNYRKAGSLMMRGEAPR